MRPYHLLKNELSPILIGSGFKETEEVIHSDDFGGAFSKFEKSKILVKVIWDGKDGVGRVDFHNTLGNPEWEGISIILNEKIEVNNEMDNLLAPVKDELRKILAFIE